MENKEQIIRMLRDELMRWDELLESQGEVLGSEERMTEPRLPGGLSYRDLMCHLWAWQQRTIARMEAALQNRQPDFSGWPSDLNPDDEKDLEPINAWIREMCSKKTWEIAYTDWRAGFLRLIELVGAIPEENLLEPGLYEWLWGQPLAFIPVASHNHHHEEHLEPLLDWLRKQG